MRTDITFDARCPGCPSQVRCQVDVETAAVQAELLAVEELDVPEGEALEEHHGRALTVDVLVDFGVDLTRTAFPAAAALSPTA
jgi:hypothetical protein